MDQHQIVGFGFIIVGICILLIDIGAYLVRWTDIPREIFVLGLGLIVIGLVYYHRDKLSHHQNTR